MKQEREYSDHAKLKHQERQDLDRLQPEKPILLELVELDRLTVEEELIGSTMEEELQAHPLRHFENMNDKEAW